VCDHTIPGLATIFCETCPPGAYHRSLTLDLHLPYRCDLPWLKDNLDQLQGDYPDIKLHGYDEFVSDVDRICPEGRNTDVPGPIAPVPWVALAAMASNMVIVAGCVVGGANEERMSRADRL
jgi:hypothetical protein